MDKKGLKSLYNRQLSFFVKTILVTAFLVIALGLLGLNMTGLFMPTQPLEDRASNDNAVAGYDYSLRSRSKLYELMTTPQESFNVQGTTNLIYESMLHSDQLETHLQDNWLQWLLGQIYPPFIKIQNPKRVVDAGGGLCSEVSSIFYTIAKTNGTDVRFIDVSGHVVIEALVAGKWKVVDADYGVTYQHSLNVLESSKGAPIITKALSSRGFSSKEIKRYISYFQSTDDNQTLLVNTAISPRLSMLEEASEWFKWIIPFAMLVLGYVLIRILNRPIS